MDQIENGFGAATGLQSESASTTDQAETGQWEAVVGFDPGSTAIKMFDGRQTLVFESVIAEVPTDDHDSAGADSAQFVDELLGPSFKLRRTKNGISYVIGAKAALGERPRYLVGAGKDTEDTAFFLDAGLLAMAPPNTKEIRASVVTQCPVGEWKDRAIPKRMQEILSGRRLRYVGEDGREVRIEVEVLSVEPEAMAVMYFLKSRLKLLPARAYKVGDFGGRTRNAAYLAQRKLIDRHSNHFEGGSDKYVVQAVCNYLRRRGITNVDTAQVRKGVRSGHNLYLRTDGKASIDYSRSREDGERDYIKAALYDLAGIWEGAPHDGTIFYGGGLTPGLELALRERYPEMVVVEEEYLRTANALGLYQRALEVQKELERTRGA